MNNWRLRLALSCTLFADYQTCIAVRGTRNMSVTILLPKSEPMSINAAVKHGTFKYYLTVHSL